jgi:23S rRNA (adenine2503-C2)-methyltransferase
MDLALLKKILVKEPPFRLKQAKKAIFKDLIEDWSEITTLSLSLREKLKEKYPLKIQAESFVSGDKRTVKAVIILKDNLKIEAVLMRHKNERNTVCVSSQVGCPLGCAFCATGKSGFKRNLEVFEIIEQVLFFARYLKKEKQKITNIVFMGMGEPFLNYDNVLGAIKALNNKEGFNFGARRFSISTVGIIKGIEKLAEEKLEVNLAISLHAPDDDLRSKIMPINRKYPLSKILKAIEDYIKKTRRRVMFEYIMIKDLNDSDGHAKKLAELMKKRELSFVNLISYNPTGIFKPSSITRIKKFKDILEKAGIVVTQRYRFGQDVKGACGQLAAK